MNNIRKTKSAASASSFAIGAICAALVSVFALTCDSFDFSNHPLDQDNVPPSHTTYTITFHANDGGGAAPNSQTANSGSTITLPDQGDLSKSGFTFGGWNTNSAGNGTTYSAGASYTVTDNITLYAKWDAASTTPTTYTLTVNAQPGGTVNSSETSAHNAETNVEVCAMPSSGYVFTGWSGASTSENLCVTITMNDNLTLTANFEEIPPSTFTLTASANPSAGGSVTRDPSQTGYNAGTPVTVTATASTNYRFTGWTGTGAPTTATINPVVTVTMNSDLTLIANFEPITYTLTIATPITTGGGTGGSTSLTTGPTTHNAGTSVTVTATATSGYRFTGWSGASTSTNATVTVLMDGNKTLTANFIRQWTLTVNRNPSAGGTVTGAGTYDHGTSVSVSATAANGYRFTSWSGASTSTSTTTSVLMDGNKTLTANFEQQSVTPGFKIIDNFDDGDVYAETGEVWYNFVFKDGTSTASISNADRVINSTGGYAEIADVRVTQTTWDPGNWAQASIALLTAENGTRYNLAGCTGGFRYRYRGNAHRVVLVRGSGASQIEYYIEVNSSTSWTTRTASLNSFIRNVHDAAYNAGQTSVPLDLSWVREITWSILPSGDVPIDISGYLQIDDVECIGSY